MNLWWKSATDFFHQLIRSKGLLRRDHLKLSYSIVLYNTPIKDAVRLYHNISDTVPDSAQYQIIFVNNSPENIELSNWLESLDIHDEHVIVIHASENKGFGAGHNLAIEQIDSDFHFLVNPDISIPDTLQISKIISYMQASQVVMCNPKILSKDGTIQKLVKRTPTVFDMGIRFLGKKIFPKRQKWFVYDDAYGVEHTSINLSGSFMACETKALKKVGGFDERYFLYMEDADLTREMASVGLTSYYPHAYVYHDWQRQNRKSLKGIITMLNSMRKYFDKWGWKLL